MAESKRKGRKAAVALGYEPGKDQAPRVVAAGEGEIADAILRAAAEHGIPIHTDHPLAGALVKLQIGQYLPPELYGAVAEILAFLWRREQEEAAKGG